MTEIDRGNYVLAVGEAAWTGREQNSPCEIPSLNVVILQGNSIDNASDGSHTFSDLYYARMLLNAALFNEWDRTGNKQIQRIQKSRRHHDGEPCFGGGWFVVQASILQPSGFHEQINFHYPEEHWDMFQIWARQRADEWDGSNHEESYNRLAAFIKMNAHG